MVVLKELISKYFHFVWELAMIVDFFQFFFVFFFCFVCVCVCVRARAPFFFFVRHQIVRFEVVHVLWVCPQVTPHFHTVVVPLFDGC